jgi:hypothetical protein
MKSRERYTTNARAFVRRYSNALVFAGVTVGVFLTRIPSFKLGPGRDPDAWRLLGAGISISETGSYTMSRPPGYPVPEYFYSLLHAQTGLLVPLVALLGAIAVAFFALAARRLGCKDVWLSAAAVAMTPVVYINGTNLMDYTWALAFVMAAFYFVLVGRPTVAGVLTGIAVGCRITSVAMLIPFGILTLLAQKPIQRHGVVGTAKLWIACLVASAVCYVPVLSAYGTEGVRAVDEGRGVTHMLNTVGEGVWGTVGVIAIVIGLGTMIVRWFKKGDDDASMPATLPERHVQSWLAVIIVYTAAFVRLPHEAGYLILIVPFVVLLFAKLLHQGSRTHHGRSRATAGEEHRLCGLVRAAIDSFVVLPGLG